MGLATLMAIPVFEKRGFQRWLRVALLANALMTPLIAVVYFYPDYSYNLLVLGFPWGITAPASMLLLAIFFKKNLKEKGHIISNKEEDIIPDNLQSLKIAANISSAIKSK